jgi:hypothetical protein
VAAPVLPAPLAGLTPVGGTWHVLVIDDAVIG